MTSMKHALAALNRRWNGLILAAALGGVMLVPSAARAEGSPIYLFNGLRPGQLDGGMASRA